MMVISLHDRISGHAKRVPVLDRFLADAKSKPSVWFARKGEIAKWAVEHQSNTPIYDRGARADGQRLSVSSPRCITVRHRAHLP
jgi:hypothetical protein